MGAPASAFLNVTKVNQDTFDCTEISLRWHDIVEYSTPLSQNGSHLNLKQASP